MNFTPEYRHNLSVSKTGIKNPMWKGDQVGYSALHDWVKRQLPKPKNCQDCGLEKPLDLANINQEYKRDLSDWEWLCRKCHMTKDGRFANIIDSQLKLTNEEAQDIYAAKGKITAWEIATMYPITETHIWAIWQRFKRNRVVTGRPNR